MLFLIIFLFALTNLFTLAAAAAPPDTKGTPAEGEEGHIEPFTMAKTATPGMVSHYLGNGVVAHIPASAAPNTTWVDKHTGKDIHNRMTTGCSGLDCQGVYICSQENWKGTCVWQQAGGGSCHPYPYSRSSSFGVDMNLQCAFYQVRNCGEGDTDATLTWPGTSNVNGLAWWGRPASYRCRHCLGCIYGNAPSWDGF